jgi:hypothetical protein
MVASVAKEKKLAEQQKAEAEKEAEPEEKSKIILPFNKVGEGQVKQ